MAVPINFPNFKKVFLKVLKNRDCQVTFGIFLFVEVVLLILFYIDFVITPVESFCFMVASCINLLNTIRATISYVRLSEALRLAEIYNTLALRKLMIKHELEALLDNIELSPLEEKKQLEDLKNELISLDKEIQSLF